MEEINMIELALALAGQSTPPVSDRRKLEAIFIAYDKALENSDAKIPTVLHAAIEAARK